MMVGLSYRSRRSWIWTDAVSPGLEQEDDTEIEDEEDTLRMTQEVSNNST